MAHGMTVENSYVGRLSAWHQLGKVYGRGLTRQDIEADGIIFDVHKEQIEHKGKSIKSWGLFHENGTFIANCGEGYAIHPVSEIFDAMDELLDGQPYETAGIIGDYQKVWGLGSIKHDMRVGDDKIEAYLAGITSFDGSMASTFMETCIRIVCANTLNAALSSTAKKQLHIRHTSKSHRKFRDSLEAMAAIKGDFGSMEQKLNFLNSRMVTPSHINNILDMILENPNDANKTDKMAAVRENKRRENILNEIIGLYESNDSNAFPEQRGTAYNLLNAITNYADHERGTRTSGDENSDIKRSVSALFTSGANLKTKALEVITVYAQQAPLKPQRQFVTAVSSSYETPLLDAILNGD